MTLDTDGDVIGNNADTDDDGDDVPDVSDAFPLNAEASVDTDGDGKPDTIDQSVPVFNGASLALAAVGFSQYFV
ncbi:MAG: hypothetical protein R3E67_08975 [Pseudomonadales bacterium]